MVYNLISHFLDFITRFEMLRRVFWKNWYRFVNRMIPDHEVAFLNYGYCSSEIDEKTLQLQPQDEVNRTCIQLYYFLASQLELKNKKVLEVGSGRGGGASFMARYFEPKSLVAVDLSSQAIRLCQKQNKLKNLQFRQGSAEHLPCIEEEFHVVFNVESSHCYGSVDLFLSEVKRVLKPDGHFLMVDFRQKDDLPKLEKSLHDSGLKLVENVNISPNIIEALDREHEKKMAKIQGGLPKMVQNLFCQFAATKGTKTYGHFQTGHFVYKFYHLQKEN